MEETKVYFTSFKTSEHENLIQKLHRLMKQAGFESIDFNEKIRGNQNSFWRVWKPAFFVQIMRKWWRIM